MRRRLLSFYRKYMLEIWFTAALAAAVAFMYLSHIRCFFKAATGVDCMSCGMTRAYISLFSGRISDAFYYHPLFWSVPIVYLVLFFRKKFSARFLAAFTTAVIAVFLGVYFIRLFLMPDSLIYIGL